MSTTALPKADAERSEAHIKKGFLKAFPGTRGLISPKVFDKLTA
jgi:hypothetical protein